MDSLAYRDDAPTRLAVQTESESMRPRSGEDHRTVRRGDRKTGQRAFASSATAETISKRADRVAVDAYLADAGPGKRPGGETNAHDPSRARVPLVGGEQRFAGPNQSIARPVESGGGSVGAGYFDRG